MNHWIRPSCDSRTGASHLRRGAPCQDASGYVGCRDAAGTPIQVLVVSDGHGGSRYVRSDVGARLACSVAMRELQQALAAVRVPAPGALEEWRGWLAEELPARIVAAWRHEVEAHWRADPGAEGAGFSPLLYGATLGVLLLTPHWWAHTGLGDWDLVCIEAAGGEALLSEEPEREAGGEATFSLCLAGAERHFAARTALHPLGAEEPPFALLLSTDGLRKSCSSDADFLTLCRYLAGLSPSRAQGGSAELAEALDHISAQGSGDDISVVVGRWGWLQQAAVWPEPGRFEPESLVQPKLVAAATAVPAPQASGGAGLAGPRAVPARTIPSAGDRRGSAARLLSGAAVLLGLAGAGLLIGGRLGLGPLAGSREPRPPSLTPQQRGDLQRQVAALCSSAPPASSGPTPLTAGRISPGKVMLDPKRQQRIAATLASRASVFQRLQSGDPAQVDVLLRQSRVDPLSALIAYSATDVSLRPPAAPAVPPRGWQGLVQRLTSPWPRMSRSERNPSVAASPLASLGACPELHQALRSAWQRHGSPGAAAPSPVSAVSSRNPVDTL